MGQALLTGNQRAFKVSGAGPRDATSGFCRDTKMTFPREFVVRREIYAIQLFGRNLLERIPPDAVILADCPSAYTRMIEVVWQEKRYAVFERDLKERTEPVEKLQDEDPPPVLQ